MPRRRGLLSVLGATALLSAGLLTVAEGHLCDNVYRQPDKLIVKPELMNIIVKDSIAFKVFLQNNMDRGIEQIRLGGQSPAFDVSVTPEQMQLPQGARVFFNVELKTKPNTPSGSYPLDFRLYAVKGNAEQEFKRFSLGGTVARVVPRLPKVPPAEGSAGQTGIQVDGRVAEPAWARALVTSNFRNTQGAPASPQTVALTVFDSTAFYFAFSCLEPEPAGAGAKDSVALRLSPPAGGALYSLTVCADGTLAASVRDKDGVRDVPASLLSAKVTRAEAEWTAEMAVPWTFFAMEGPPKPGETWGLNIVRQRAAGAAQTSFWAGLPGNYEDPASYGQLLFAPEP